MFRIFTVLLFTYYLYRLFSPIDNKKYGLFFKQFEDEKDIGRIIQNLNFVELVEFKKTIIGFIVILFQQIIEFSYLTLALKHDPLRYPTIAMLLWWIIVLTIPNKESIDDVLAKVDTPKYITKKKIIAIIDVLYFGYMFIVIVKQYF